MKSNLKFILLIILSSIILSCSQKDKIESKNNKDLNEKLTIISNKLSSIESVLERISLDEKTLASLKTNENIIGPIIESGLINYILEYSNLEKLEKRISEVEQSRHDESHVKIDPFQENIYPINVRYGSLVFWMKRAQNNSEGFEVKIAILNTLSVDIGDLTVSLHANYNSGLKTKNGRQYFSSEKISKIKTGKFEEVSIKFVGENIKDVDSFTADILVLSVQPN